MNQPSGPPGVSQDPLLNQTLHGTYLIEQLLGQGGMGAVYAARHLRLPKRFAIKVLHAQMATNRDVFGRFRREAEITSALRHQHIVEVVDFNQLDNGMPYLVMEFLSGEDLFARLQRQRRLPLPEALEMARQVGSALQAAHDRGVVHRDLKPQNIFICQQEELGQVVETVKVVDFGISKIRHPEVGGGPATTDGTLLGTPSYMSPEQAAGRNHEIDARTDQYALATIIYEMLSGRVAFAPESGEGLTGVLIKVVTQPAPPLEQLCPDLPERVLGAVRRAMSKSPAERFASVTEMLEALGAAHRPGTPAPAELPAALAERAAPSGAPKSTPAGTASPSARQGAPATPATSAGVVPSGLAYTGQPSLVSAPGMATVASPPPSVQGRPAVTPPPSSVQGPPPVAPPPPSVQGPPSVAPPPSVQGPPGGTVAQPGLMPSGLTPPSTLTPIGGSIKPAAEINFGKWFLWATLVGGGGFLVLALLAWQLLFR